jgi:hypothetical protein
MKYVIGAVALIGLIAMGSWMGLFVISGLILFGAIVAMIETIPWLRWFVARTANFWDFVLFGLSIYLLFSAGVTVAFATGIAGLLYTVYYKPFLIKREALKKA